MSGRTAARYAQRLMGTRLLERDEVVGAVSVLLAGAAQRNGTALLLEAAAGMGKTSVLDTAFARATGIRIIGARGVSLEQGFPLGLVRQLLAPALHGATASQRTRWLAGGARAAGPVLQGHAAAPVEEYVAFNALYWLVAAMTTDAPLALVIDDLHWCDPESLGWLGFIARRMDGLNLVLLMATRTGEAAGPHRALDALRQEPRVRTAQLEPLSRAATATIIHRHDDAAEDAFVEACHEACGGNPFLLRELLSAVEQAGLAPVAANAGRATSLASAGLQRSVAARLDALGPDATRVAEAAALLGSNPTLPQVSALADIPLEDAATAARDLGRADILGAGPRLDFRHPLLRTAILANLGEVAAAARHARAARVLFDLSAPAEEVAAHLLACPPVGEGWAAEMLERAAREAQAHGSPAMASRLLERALDEPVGEDRRAVLETRRGTALMTAGDERGIDTLLRVREDMRDPIQRAALLVRLSFAMAAAGRGAEVVRLLAQTRAELPAGRPDIVFRLAAERALAAGQASGERASVLVDEAVGLITEDDDLQTRVGFAQLAIASLFTNRPAFETAGFARRAIGVDSAAHQEAIDASQPMAWAVTIIGLCEDGETPVEEFARCEAGARQRGAIALGLTLTFAWRALYHVRCGALLDAEADGDAALETAPQNSFLLNCAPAVIAKAVAYTERGHPARALALIDEHIGRPGMLGAVRAWVDLERVPALHALGRCAEAADTALAVGAQARAVEVDSAVLLPWRRLAAESLLACGADLRAAALAADELALATRFGAPGPIGSALRVLGLAERDLERLRTAEQTLAGSNMRLEHARALVDLGAALRRDGRRAAARDPLYEGVEIATRCGATVLAERAREELRAAGGRPRRVLRSGIEALTPSELRTARLAAEGLTNREIAQRLFVTQKTVETQLHATYGKLDVVRRGELSAALAD
ncbi:MAG: transcriptional regulator, LuxR family [Solirubrobacterales bacterium]|nr:transcriptional regulator, LuxR family [Solirubrobacterales bacterium]